MKKKSNVYSDIEFFMGSMVFIFGIYIIISAQPVIKLFIGLPLVLVSFLAFYLGYLCLD